MYNFSTMFAIVFQLLDIVKCKYVWEPYGVLMCRELCDSYRSCYSPMFIEKDRACGLSGSTTDTPARIENCSTRERHLLTKRRGYTCVADHKRRWKPTYLVVFDGKSEFAYNLQRKEWMPINRKEFPYRVTLAEESGCVYSIYKPSNLSNRGYIIQRAPMWEPHRKHLIFSQEKNIGSIELIGVDEEMNTVFFTVCKDTSQPDTLLKKAPDRPPEEIQLRHEGRVGGLIVNPKRRSLYLLLSLEGQYSLVEQGYTRAITRRYKLPPERTISLDLDINDNVLYYLTENTRSACNLYKLNIQTSSELTRVKVFKQRLNLILVSDDYIYTLGVGNSSGGIYNKTMQLIETIRGGCRDVTVTGYIKR